MFLVEKKTEISIHSLLAEGDIDNAGALKDLNISIHSLLAEGDRMGCSFFIPESISIHSLLAEGDRSPHRIPSFPSYFNPLPPRRGRPGPGGAGGHGHSISIHSLLAEGDIAFCCALSGIFVFQSTPSSQRETR